ncbi:MAG: hypothetical protein H7A21_03015 [Spirochaetales bacterium]|nr:hypothetical protein [Leptospiraceae bacterium]MCP5480381.1 hypothetical protein [Spirochaetales bacterium]
MKLSSLLLYRRFQWSTAMRPEEALAKLAPLLRRRRWIRFFSFGGGFEGEIAGNAFTVRRILYYRNAFRAEITGHILKTTNGSVIHVTMQPHALVIAFLTVWFGGVILACLALAAAVLLTLFFQGPQAPGPVTEAHDPEGDGWRIILIPPGLLLGGAALVHGGFQYDVWRAQKELKAIFQVPKTENPD